ncbi:MAG TPA: alpha/beta fold hydrolase [Steroidobacteraceae bacterium]|nr:alpha/beta fold hydrolase [Steroidobacteraceae bacterium]
MISRRGFGAALLLAATLAWCGAAHAASAKKHVVVAEGFNLTVWEKSARKPKAAILLVHGRTWSALPNFDLQVPGENRSIMDALSARGYAVYAVDLRGYGGTARDASGWLTPQRAADDVASVLAWMAQHRPALARPTLLGYSRGAHVSLLMAQQHPELISSLVLFALPRVSAIAATVPPADPPRHPTTRAAAAEDFITRDAASRAVIDAYVEQAVAANPVRSDWRDEHQFAFDASRVSTPTLLLYGANDPLLTPAVADFFASLAARDRSFIVLPASDHAAHVENSQAAWLHAVDAFVTSPRATASAVAR